MFSRLIRLPVFLLAMVLVWPAHAQLSRKHRPMAKVGPYELLFADFHMHTVFSDGEVWPTTRVREAWVEGLDVISITDHDDYRPNEKHVSMDLEQPYAIARPLAEALGLLIIPGVEITKGDIHFNALFVKDHNAFRGKPLLEALAEAKQQGAYSFWNHPGWRGKAEWWPPIATAYSDKLFQGIELLNGPSFYAEAHPWIEQYGLAVIGNSDIHAPSQTEDLRTLTLVLSRERTLAGVREALEARRTIAWNGKQMYGEAQWLEGLFRACVQLPARVRFVPGLWGAGLPMENRCSVNFEVQVEEAPKWLETRAAHLPASAASMLPLRRLADAPQGEERVKLRLAVGNALAGPGRALSLPVEFTIEP